MRIRIPMALVAMAAVIGGSVFACSSGGGAAPAGPKPGPSTTTTASASDTTDAAPPADDAAPPADDAAPWNTYPDPPYGFKVNQTVPPLTFRGKRDGSPDWVENMSLADYYDPDGSRGFSALYIEVSAVWCVWCRYEAKELPGWYLNAPNDYQKRGSKFLTALIQDGASPPGPSTPDDVDSWQKLYKVPFDMALDDGGQMFPPWARGLPLNFVVDPRTMKVYRIIDGVTPDATNLPQLDALLKRNGAPGPTLPDPGDAGTD